MSVSPDESNLKICICLAYTFYKQDSCEHKNEVNLSGEPMREVSREVCEHINKVNLSGESFREVSVVDPSPEEQAMAWVKDSKSTVTLDRSTPRCSALPPLFFHNKVQSEPELSCKYLRQHLDAMASTQSECDWFGGAVECSDDGVVTGLRLGIPQVGLDIASNEFDFLRCFVERLELQGNALTGPIPTGLGI